MAENRMWMQQSRDPDPARPAAGSTARLHLLSITRVDLSTMNLPLLTSARKNASRSIAGYSLDLCRL